LDIHIKRSNARDKRLAVGITGKYHARGKPARSASIRTQDWTAYSLLGRDTGIWYCNFTVLKMRS